MKLKRMLSLLLVVCLVLPVFPATARAAEVASGFCGNNVTWMLTNDGTLTISGTGDMANYDIWRAAPWYSYRSSITRILVRDTVTEFV